MQHSVRWLFHHRRPDHRENESPETDFIFLLTTSCSCSIWYVGCSITDVLTQEKTNHQRQTLSFYSPQAVSCSIRYVSRSITDVLTQGKRITRDRLYLFTHHKLFVQHSVRWLFHHRRPDTGKTNHQRQTLSFYSPQAVRAAFGTLVVPSQTSSHREDESPETDFISLPGHWRHASTSLLQ